MLVKPGMDDKSMEFNVFEARIPELVREVLQILDDCNLPLTPRVDYDFISKFVRVKKYDAEKAASAIKKYYEHVHWNLKRIEGTKPSDFIPAFETKASVILKNKFRGTKISYTNIAKWDTKKCSYQELLSSALFVCEEFALIKDLQPHGNIMIFDMAGLNLSHLRQLTCSDVKYSIQVALHGLPSRIEGIHVINPPTIFWPLHRLIMKFVPQKIRNRFHVHSNLESLHSSVDKRVLPRSLGGDLDEDEATDSEFVNRIIAENKCYDEYWSSEIPKLPKHNAISRRRSSVETIICQINPSSLALF